jgi:type II secretory pathway component PulJ
MRIRRDEQGGILLELLVAAGITALIAGLLASIVFQFFRTSEKGTEGLIALHEVQNTTQWITRDVTMAETSDLVDGAPAVQSMTLTWTEGVMVHTVTYSLSGTDLQRVINGQVGIVARNVSSISFSLSNNVITTTIVSSPESRWGVSKELTSKAWLRTTG